MGLEDKAGSAANIAGYWTVGVVQGVIVILVPMFMAGMAAGFLKKLVQVGAKVGGN